MPRPPASRPASKRAKLSPEDKKLLDIARALVTKEVLFEVISGVAGPCYYLNAYRIVGNKPWGEGTVVRSDSVPVRDLLHALTLPTQESEETEPPAAKQPKATARMTAKKRAVRG